MNTQNPQQSSLDTVFQNSSTTGMDKLSHPVFLQRIESVSVVILLLIAYNALGFAWWLMAVLVLVPDLSIIAYAKNQQFGARAYNAVHNYSVPVLLAVAGIGSGMDLCIAIALIWATHIALDRALGYGLKYTTSFRHTHLSWK